jgi:hypothetical protein
MISSAWGADRPHNESLERKFKGWSACSGTFISVG